jgi:hydroxymethylpyrimidine pyrophosphatase-like HAD family hydrolase
MRRTTALAHKPPVRLIKALEAQGVTPNVGRVVLCTKRKHEPIFRAVLRNLKLDYELSFNGKSMMATPKGINKRTGLAAALDELGLKPRHVVGIGDGENDVPLLKGCAFGVAVANAVDELKAQAGHVTQGRAGRGVCELIDQLLNDDLRAWQHGRLA